MKNILLIQALTLISFSICAADLEFSSMEEEQQWQAAWDGASERILAMCGLVELTKNDMSEEERQQIELKFNQEYTRIKNKRDASFKPYSAFVSLKYPELQSKYNPGNFEPFIMNPIIAYLKVFKKYEDSFRVKSEEIVLGHIKTIIRRNLELFCCINSDDYNRLIMTARGMDFIPEQWVKEILCIFKRARSLGVISAT